MDSGGWWWGQALEDKRGKENIGREERESGSLKEKHKKGAQGMVGLGPGSGLGN